MKIVYLIPIAVLFIITGCVQEPIIGGCGTVTPGLENECCANVMKDKPHVMCVGQWEWNKNNLNCEFKCEIENDKR